MTYIPAPLRRLVEERSNFKCEYCLIPTATAFFPHEIDHVIAQKHGGLANADNLAFSCWRCNRHKGTDLGSFDPQTGTFNFLFNLRIQRWNGNFRIEEIRITGMTPEGRTTTNLLQFNSHECLAERQKLIELGIYSIS
jgi:hypothetical protein